MKKIIFLLVLFLTSFSLLNAQDFVQKNSGRAETWKEGMPSVVISPQTPTNPPTTRGIIFEEGFENSGDGTAPAGWEVSNLGTGEPWITVAGLYDGYGTLVVFPHSGTRFATNLYNEYGPRDAWMFSPGFTLEAGTAYTISFWLKLAGYVPWGEMDSFSAHIGQGQTVAAMTTTLYYNDQESYVADWTEITYFFTPSTTGTYNIGFHAFSLEDYGNDIDVDDILVVSGGPCEPITNLEADVTDNDVVLTWTAATDATAYDVYVNGSLEETVTGTTVTFNGMADGVHKFCVEGVFADDCIPQPVCVTATVGDCYDIQIGTGTTTGYSMPVNTFYGNSYVQHIFTPDEIGGEGIINSVSFQYIYGISNPKVDQTYYLGYTTKDVFASTTDYVPISDLTQVFAGNLVYNNANEWFTVEFDTPFNHNQPNCNLVLAVLNNNHDYTTSSNPTFRYTAGTSNKTLYRQLDGSTSINPANPGAGTLSVNRSNTLFNICAGATPPECNPPTDLAVLYDITCTKATITWVPGADSGCETTYNVYRDDQLLGNVSVTSYTDLTYDPAEGHTWKVETVCPGGGTPSATITKEACSDGCDTEQVGTGTTGSYAIPINTFYMYSYTQQIFLANEIGDAGEITALSFQYIYSNATTKNPLTIYLANTTQEVFAAANGNSFMPATEMQQVFSGSVTFSNGWVTIIFDTPFEYAGCNLLVAVLNNNGAYDTGSNNTFNLTAVGANRTIEYHKDSTPAGAIDPNNMPTGTYNLSLNRVNTIFKICDRYTPGIDAPVALPSTSNCTSFTANWEAADGAFGYYLNVYSDNGSVLQNYNVGDVTSYEVTVTPGGLVTYYYTVQAYNDCFTSNVSNEMTGTLLTYEIVASAGSGGTIDPSGTVTVDCGSTPTYTFIPDQGYTVYEILINGESVPPAGSYTFPPITENMTIIVSFGTALDFTWTTLPDMCNVNPPCGAGGAIYLDGGISFVPMGDCAGAVPLQNNTIQKFDFIPTTGYKIAAVYVDEVLNLTAALQGSYTFYYISEPHSLYVEFEKVNYDITAKVYGNGSITDMGTVYIDHGCDKLYKFQALPYHEIAHVFIDGVDNEDAINSGTYTFTNITKSHTIDVVFTPNVYTIMATAEPGKGYISPSGQISVTYGENKTFNFKAASGYKIDKVVIDDVINMEAAQNGSYSFVNVKDNHTIELFFDELRFKIASISAPNGTIEPEGITEVLFGENITYTITPDEGYKISFVLVNGDNIGAIPTYTFAAIEADGNIEAFFEFMQPTGIDDVTLEGISIYSHVNIVYLVNEKNLPISDVSIFDMYGRTVWQGTPQGNQITLNVANGIYTVRVTSDDSFTVTKVNIQR